MDEQKPARILVVDDSTENLKLLQAILGGEGYAVRALSDGEAALHAARTELPDLILLDVKMPGLDGYEVCARLRADPVTREVPVIFISSLPETKDKLRGFGAGGVDYIGKPFHVEEILARVATHLRLNLLQKSLRQQNQDLQEAAAVFEVSNDGIFLTDAEGLIRRVNPAFTEITGYCADEVLGKAPQVLKSGHHPPEFFAQLRQDLERKGYWEGEIWNRHKNGSIFPQWQRITVIHNVDGAVSGSVAQFSDIARRKLTEEEIRYRGNFDALTGLANRSLLLERLGLALREHQRNRRKLSLLVIDLGRFKQINESLGYLAGDALLQQVAARLQEEIRDIDLAARIGGDEFVLVLVEQADFMVGKRVAQRVLERLQQPFTLPEGEAEVVVSIGIGLFSEDGVTVDQLLRNATLAMSIAKSEGGNRMHFFTPAMGEELRRRLGLEADLRQALAHHELRVHYQPIVDVCSGRPVGVEALLRWQHPEQGTIPPDRFIPIAEECGLISSIGLWVIETVCRQLQQWQQQGLDLYASVNISAHQIPHGVSSAWLLDLVRRSGLAPQRLVLEITESVLAEDVDAVAAWLSEMRAGGFRVYLDDFGTGYSSLSYLKNFPVDAVKIDRAFVRDMVEQRRDLDLVRAIVAICQSLDLEVVAEGIETEAQQRLLCELKCHYGQGYLFSKPLPADELAAVLMQS